MHWLARLQDCSPVVISEPSAEVRDVTVAAALLGLSAAVARCFGVELVELEAEDDGSWKLVKFYERLGFEISKDKPRPSLRLGQPAMHSKSAAIACLAPTSWQSGIVPSNFDPQAFVIENEIIFEGKTDKPICWGFKASKPACARVRVSLECHPNSLEIEVALHDRHGIVLVAARGEARIRQGVSRLTWLGRNAKQPAHPNVKGRKAYPIVGRVRQEDDCEVVNSDGGDDKVETVENKVTAAVALLGILAELASQVGSFSFERL